MRRVLRRRTLQGNVVEAGEAGAQIAGMREAPVVMLRMRRSGRGAVPGPLSARVPDHQQPPVTKDARRSRSNVAAISLRDPQIPSGPDLLEGCLLMHLVQGAGCDGQRCHIDIFAAPSGRL